MAIDWHYVKDNAFGPNVIDIQLELGSTATAYEPYEGQTVPLYDGTLRSLPDGTRDTLALSYLRPSTREGWALYDRELVQRVGSVDLGELNWLKGKRNNDNTGYIFRSPSDVGMLPTAISGFCTAYENRPDMKYNNADEGLHLYQFALKQSTYANGRFLVCDEYDTAADFKAAVNGVTAIYPLATPVTTQLDQIELPVLPAPTCTVWSDPTTGLVMEYVQDTNLVVQSLSAETAIAYASIAVTDGPTATASHAVGTYLTMDGTLYKVTQAIAVGETIAAGTNVTATTVMAELIARTA